MKTNNEQLETNALQQTYSHQEEQTYSHQEEHLVQINNLVEKIDNLVNEIQTDREISIQKDNQEQEDQKKKEEENLKLQKEKEEENLELQKEKEEKQENFLTQFTTLVENSDITQTLTYQEEINQKLEELILQKNIDYIFQGVLIAFCCVLIFQNQFKR